MPQPFQGVLPVSPENGKGTSSLTIIYLTKAAFPRSLLLYEAKSHFFLGFAADAEACNCFLKSRFMLANNFLVGTR